MIQIQLDPIKEVLNKFTIVNYYDPIQNKEVYLQVTQNKLTDLKRILYNIYGITKPKIYNVYTEIELE